MTRILVIEDNGPMRDVLASGLARFGYAVDAAASGEEGLRRAAKQAPDLVLTDLDLPGLDGIAVCTTLKADPGLAAVPVLVMTGRQTWEAMARAQVAGAQAVLAKPFTWEELLDEIERSLPARV